MGAIRRRLASELRGRWRGWLGLVLLLAAFAGLTFATTAGARRTDSAYRRLLDRSHPYDQFLLDVGPNPVPFGDTPFAQITLKQLDDMRPLVADYLTSYFFDGPPDAEFGAIASPDARMDHSFNTARIVSGHLPEAADEAAVPVAIADRLHARVGGTITLRMVKDAFSDNPSVVPMTFKVTAIIAVPGEFPPDSDLGPPRVHLTPAFYEKYNVWGAFPYTLVRLQHGPADLPAFRAALARITGNKGVIGYTQAALTRNVERSFRLQAVALYLFAICLAIVALLVIGQTLGRQTLSEGVEYPTLRALGMTRSDLFWLGLVRGTLITLAGLVLAVPVAVLLSPLAPRGLARAADPNPGFHFDAVALLAGAGIALVTLTLFLLIPAARAARQAEREGVFGASEPGAQRASRAVEAITRTGASAPAVVGVRLALEPGRGRTAVPVRSTIAGVVLAITALVVTLGFGASLDHLLETPRLYGLTWSADVGWDEVTPPQYQAAFAKATADPDVAIAGPISLGAPFLVDGVQADGMALEVGDKTFQPPLEEGRVPVAADEIALGPKTLRRIHKSIGDTVDVSIVGIKPVPFRIVGRMVLPTVGHTANLGEGSLFTFEAFGKFFSGNSTEHDDFAVRFKDGVDPKAAIRRLQALVVDSGANVAEPATPGDLLNFGRSKNLPFILSGLLAMLALATLGHALVSSINRRRRDFAICKTLGFTRRDVARAVVWQSSTFIVVSLGFGILFGVIAGRWLWGAYANQLGVVSVPRVPVWTVVAIVPIAVVVANALAMWPARAAARTRPAIVLRTE